MSQLSQLAETLIGSEIVRLGNEINDRIRKGEKIYNYTIGDFDPAVFPIPSELEQLIIESYRNHYTNYPPADGVAELRQAVAQFIEEGEGIRYAPNEILIASGGRPLIYTIFKSVVNPGDKVIYAVPSWNNNHYVHLTGAHHCVVEAVPEHDFMPTAVDIAPFVKGAALICLCTPQNPTGTTLPKAELEKICDMVLAENAQRGEQEKKLYLLFDQMYWTLTYGSTEHCNPVSVRPAMKEYTIFVDGMSKAFASTGLRIGWSMGPAKVIGRMKALLSHLGAWAPMAEQKAAAQYLLQKEAIQRYLGEFKQGLEQRLRLIYDGFIRLKEKGYRVDAITPQAAIYLTIQLNLAGQRAGDRVLENQADVTQYILDKAKLAVVPFYAFGAGNQSPWYRLSVGTCRIEEIPDMFAKLEEALAALK